MRARLSREALATALALVAPLAVAGFALYRGPHPVTLVLVAPEGTRSSGLSVHVYRGSDRVTRPENLVATSDERYPDEKVRVVRVPVRLTRGDYRVRALYDCVLLDSGIPPPLDAVVHVTRSETIVLRLDPAPACPR